MCQPSFYNRLFAKVYDPIMRNFEAKVLQRRRRRILAGIQGHALEIGAGTGVNFPLYPADAHVIAIEPSEPMLKIARKKLKNSNVKADIRLLHLGIGNPALASYVPAGGFDDIVCTLVLCTVPDLEASIELIKKWLKPGGTLHVLEHIYAEKPVPRFFQNILNPLWRHLAEGCNLNRQTDEVLKAHGFLPEWEERVVKGGVPLYYGIMRQR